MEINATGLVQIVLFLGLLLWLSYFLFAPLLKLFDERERRIEGARAEAEKLAQKAHGDLSLIEDRVHAAQRDARQILATLKSEGVELQRRMIDDARHQAKTKLEEARLKIDKESRQAREQLNRDTDKLADDMLNRLLEAK